MADIVWLASYMKSGNTWARALLTNYIVGGGEPADINALGAAVPVGYARSLFDAYCGLKLSALSAPVIFRLRPEIYRTLAKSAKTRQFLKVHDDWCRTDHGDALFPADCTAGVCYFVRNVLDIAASLANHGGVGIGEAVAYLCRSHRIKAHTRDWRHQAMPQFFGPWRGHVESWLDESGLPCLVLRYEDMKADTVSALRRMIRFVGMEVDEARLIRAVTHSRFEVLQAQEREKGFSESSFCASGNFFRKGRVGGWREELTPDQVRRLIDVHGAAMTRFGYLDARGEPV